MIHKIYQDLQNDDMQTLAFWLEKPLWFPLLDKILQSYISFKITEGTNDLTVIKSYSWRKEFPCPNSIILVTDSDGNSALSLIYPEAGQSHVLRDSS